MAQGSVTIASDKTLKASLPDINTAFQVLLSSSSGTSFPIDNLVVGMTCYRSDQLKLYRLLDLSPIWHLEFDFSKTFGAADTSLTADKALALNANPSDTSTIATIPNDYNGVLKFVGMKTATAIGLTTIDSIDGATLSFVCGVRGSADSTGGVAHELAFCSNGKMYQRYGSTTAWGAWIRLASKADVDAVVTTLTNQLAPINSPILTGTPKAPTAPTNTNTEQIATTKFVQNLLSAIYPVGFIYMSANATSPATLFGFGTWERIQDRFLLAAGSYGAGTIGGEATHTLTESEKGSHFHGFGYHNNNNNGTFVSTGGTATSYPLKSWTTGAFWNGNGGGSSSGADVSNLNLITSLGVTDTPIFP